MKLAGMAPAFVLVVLLMSSGYFLIYNVFYISIASDIRWFGMMKTIGATSKQLNAILRRQVIRLDLWGISLGVAAGYLVGLQIAPSIIAMTDWGVYYKRPPFIPVAICAVLFSWITVRISSGTPFRLAASISPVEAARYTPKRHSGIFAMISLALSGILFLAVSNATMGFRVEQFVERMNQNDYQITHKASRWDLTEDYRPLPPELAQDLRSLPFVFEVDGITPHCIRAFPVGRLPALRR